MKLFISMFFLIARSFLHLAIMMLHNNESTFVIMSKMCGVAIFYFFFPYRLQVYDLVEHKVQGDGNCQVKFLSFDCMPWRA